MEQQILDYYFGLPENTTQEKADLITLSWELFQALEFYQETLEKLKQLKKDPEIAKYLKYRQLRFEKYNGINYKSTEEEKEALMQKAKEYTRKIEQLNKQNSDKINDYTLLEEKIAYLSITLENRIGKDFTELSKKYRPIYIVDHIQKAKIGFTFLSHELFSRKKLVLSTNEPTMDDIDLSALFLIKSLKDGKPFLEGRQYLYMDHENQFKVLPELWFAENRTAFKENQGDFALKKYLYPNK